VSHTKISNPFLKPISRKNSASALKRHKRNKQKSAIWQQLSKDKLMNNIYSFNDSSLESSHLLAVENNQSFANELKRYDSLGEFNDSRLRLKFKEVKEKLSSTKDLLNGSHCRDNSWLTERTFHEKVSSCEKLLNSIKISPFINSKDVTITEYWTDKNIKKNLLASFDPIMNEQHNVTFDNIDESEKDSFYYKRSTSAEYRIKKVETKDNNEELSSLIVKNLELQKFNLKSIATKLQRSQSEVEKAHNKLDDEIFLKEFKVNTERRSKKMTRIHADEKYK